METDNDFLDDWLKRLEVFNVKQADFEERRNRLSEKFGKRANVRDTIWSILNTLVGKYSSDFDMLENIYKEMASFVSSEGRDPSQLLRAVDNLKKNFYSKVDSKNDNFPQQVVLGSGPGYYFKTFLGHDELKTITKLRKDGKFEKAKKLLLEAEPSQVVLDELRKMASASANIAKKEKDWFAVLQHLDGYTAYAKKWGEYCIKMVNAEPPSHTESDKKLIEVARDTIIKQGGVFPVFDDRTVQVTVNKVTVDLDEVAKMQRRALGLDDS